MSIFGNLFGRAQDKSVAFELDWFKAEARDNYMKMIALETNINFIARSVADAEFRVYDKNKNSQKTATYLLNVRPNPNESASVFWRKFITKYFMNDEVLVIQTEKHELYVADSFNFTTADSEMFPKTIENVRIGNFTMDHKYSMNDVIYLKRSENSLTGLINQMNEDIGSLYTRLIESAKRNNQIRAMVNIDATMAGNTADEIRINSQKFIDDAYKAIKENAVALVPQTKGFEYQEISNSQGVGKENVSDIKSVQDQMTDTIANMIGIPVSLIHGSNEDLNSNIKLYVEFCLDPLIKEIQDELNAKLFEKKQVIDGAHVRIIGMNKPSIFDVAESVDKLISSGTLNPNEIRDALSYEPRKGGDEYVLTKNYTSDTLKGGENNDNENSN